LPLPAACPQRQDEACPPTKVCLIRPVDKDLQRVDEDGQFVSPPREMPAPSDGADALSPVLLECDGLAFGLLERGFIRPACLPFPVLPAGSGKVVLRFLERKPS
jgi:hypothetical protein